MLTPSQEGEGAWSNAQRKKTGKRSQAVSAKRRHLNRGIKYLLPIWGSTARARSRWQSRRACQNQSTLLLPVKEVLYIAVLRQILDIWLAPLKAFREDFAPLVAIKEYIRLKLEVSRDYPQASRLFCMEMLAGAPLLMAELEGISKR